MKQINFLFVLFLFTLSSCNEIDYYNIPLYSEVGHVNAVIEIPAGTNHKIEYDPEFNQFWVDSINAQVRIIDFISYPANYGFIPSTYMDNERGGDGDALDVFVICESLPTKTVLEIIPIGMISLNDRGEIDNKIIAIPANPNLSVITAVSHQDLISKYPEIINIVKTWFLNYKGSGKIEILGWFDEQVAMKEIEKWKVIE